MPLNIKWLYRGSRWRSCLVTLGPMQSKTANAARLALLASAKRLTPEQRLKAFLGINYAVVGAMAASIHGIVRGSSDADRNGRMNGS
jgi:hypothetical protein